MASPRRRLSADYGRFGRRALRAVTLTPIVFGAAILLGFVGGESGNVLAGAAISVIVLVAPAAAVIYSVVAVQGKEPFGMSLVMGSGLVLLLVLVGLPLLVVGVGAFILGLTICLLGLLVFVGIWKRPAA